MKILVVFTGGTIGSASDGATIDIRPAMDSPLIARYRQQGGRQLEFEFCNPVHLLSENMTFQAWNALIRFLRKLDFSAYQGIVVAHGSDTISYTAALLGLLFGGVPVPMVLIASNYPLDDPRSNGLLNFTGAVDFICGSGLRGVFAVYSDRQGRLPVYLATRMVEAEPYHDQFSSFGGSPFGFLEEGRFVYCAAPENPPLSCFQNGYASGCRPVTLKENILLIRPYPGLDYRMFDLHNPPRAVLHILYHSGTACTAGEFTSLPAFIRRCRAQGIPCYVASMKTAEEQYATARELLEAGARPFYHISVEAAYAKLCVAYNQDRLPPEEYLKETVCFESLPSL